MIDMNKKFKYYYLFMKVILVGLLGAQEKTFCKTVLDVKGGPQNLQKETLSFDSLGGYEEAKDEMRRFFASLKHYQKIEALGGSLPNGVLLYGPPGVGKTKLARIVSEQLQIPFYTLNSTDITSCMIGESENKVHNFFLSLKKDKVSIVFVDEADSVFTKRGDNNFVSNGITTQFLIEMDGVSNKDNRIFFILAANNIDRIDNAILRPGRIDKIIKMDYPDHPTKIHIFKSLCNTKFKNMSLDVIRYVEKEKVLTRFNTGAEIENWLNQAAIRAGIANKDMIEVSDLRSCLNSK